jgi:hypothetical protein
MLATLFANSCLLRSWELKRIHLAIEEDNL